MPCKVPATIADNAASIQKAIADTPDVMPLLCGALIVNLVIGEVSTKVEYAREALKEVDKMIRDGKLKRYPDTRWNARFDKLGECLRSNPDPAQKGNIEKSIDLFKPIIDWLNFAQKDGTPWNKLWDKWESIFNDAENDIFKNCMKKHEPKLRNGILRIFNFIYSDYSLASTDKEWIVKFIPRLTEEIEKLESTKLMEMSSQVPNTIELFAKKN